MIFQDPISSLNPRRRIEDIVAEGLRIWKVGDDASRTAKVDEVLEAVGLDPERAKGRRPHQFSGGQCQRISIARAVVTEPDLIICDEPVSALDVSVQAQILNLLEDLKARYGLTLVFIAHDLAVVKNVSDRVAVMYLGRLCEVGPPDVVYGAPAHPYTEALLAAIPEPDPDLRGRDRQILEGELPSPLDPPSGCHFRTRCDRADEVCVAGRPRDGADRRRPLRGLPPPARGDRGHRGHGGEHGLTAGEGGTLPVRAHRTRLDPEVRRELILDAAERVLVDRNPSEVTFEEIADAAEVSRGLVYNYFRDRTALLVALAERALERLDRELLSALDPGADLPAADRRPRAAPTGVTPSPTAARGASSPGRGCSTTPRCSRPAPGGWRASRPSGATPPTPASRPGRSPPSTS